MNCPNCGTPEIPIMLCPKCHDVAPKDAIPPPISELRAAAENALYLLEQEQPRPEAATVRAYIAALEARLAWRKITETDPEKIGQRWWFVTDGLSVFCAARLPNRWVCEGPYSEMENPPITHYMPLPGPPEKP